MNREPVLILSVLAAAVIAVVTELGKGNIDSLEDVATIVAPILGGLVARSQVSPVNR